MLTEEPQFVPRGNAYESELTAAQVKPVENMQICQLLNSMPSSWLKLHFRPYGKGEHAEVGQDHHPT
ncbi:hypothetical protein AMTR_s00160p00059350 [Amborella trichopoda]|uniref:Uncharacterized protein n=1 Tax=Amborella trichopoda TaxID=13333 RepID=W1PUJ4_AMBTC|nr:hypothetical protein AMTR_s00160p00059350 [Amborella trichopoda]